MARNYKVLVRKRRLKGWRVVSYRGRKRVSKKRAKALVAKYKKRGRRVKIQKIRTRKTINNDLINKWLRGDLDFDRDMMIRLAKAARDMNHVLYVNYGKRSYSEQKALWDKYGPPRAARPGTSRHETGLAADVISNRYRYLNLGSIRGAREALKKHGLCLPVPNEPWHTEKGSTFRA